MAKKSSEPGKTAVFTPDPAQNQPQPPATDSSRGITQGTSRRDTVIRVARPSPDANINHRAAAIAMLDRWLDEEFDDTPAEVAPLSLRGTPDA